MPLSSSSSSPRTAPKKDRRHLCLNKTREKRGRKKERRCKKKSAHAAGWTDPDVGGRGEKKKEGFYGTMAADSKGESFEFERCHTLRQSHYSTMFLRDV